MTKSSATSQDQIDDNSVVLRIKKSRANQFAGFLQEQAKFMPKDEFNCYKKQFLNLKLNGEKIIPSAYEIPSSYEVHSAYEIPSARELKRETVQAEIIQSRHIDASLYFFITDSDQNFNDFEYAELLEQFHKFKFSNGNFVYSNDCKVHNYLSRAWLKIGSENFRSAKFLLNTVARIPDISPTALGYKYLTHALYLAQIGHFSYALNMMKLGFQKGIFDGPLQLQANIMKIDLALRSTDALGAIVMSNRLIQQEQDPQRRVYWKYCKLIGLHMVGLKDKFKTLCDEIIYNNHLGDLQRQHLEVLYKHI